MRFAGKTAIVTGAGSGIGLATTRRLATDGATVIMADVRDAGDEAAGIIGSENPVRFVLADVGRESQVRALVDEVVSSHGRVDILVNNAGIVFARTVPDTTLEEWDRLMDVNLKGVFLCSRAVIPIMQQQGGGVIVNVSSEQGLVGAPRERRLHGHERRRHPAYEVNGHRSRTRRYPGQLCVPRSGENPALRWVRRERRGTRMRSFAASWRPPS